MVVLSVGPSGSPTLVGKFRIAAIVNTHCLHNSEMRERKGFARALLIKAVSTVTTVVLSVGKREGGTASHTHVRVNPFGRLLLSFLVSYDTCSQSRV